MANQGKAARIRPNARLHAGNHNFACNSGMKGCLGMSLPLCSLAAADPTPRSWTPEPKTLSAAVTNCFATERRPILATSACVPSQSNW